MLVSMLPNSLVSASLGNIPFSLDKSIYGLAEAKKRGEFPRLKAFDCEFVYYDLTRVEGPFLPIGGPCPKTLADAGISHTRSIRMKVGQ